MSESEKDGFTNHEEESKNTNGFPESFKNMVEERLTYFRSVIDFMQKEKGYQQDNPNWEERLEEFKMPLNIFTTAQLLIDAVLDEPLAKGDEVKESINYIESNIVPFVEKMIEATKMAKKTYLEVLSDAESKEDKDMELINSVKESANQSDLIIKSLNECLFDFESFTITIIANQSPKTELED